MTGKRHGFHATWRVGFDDDGRLQALEATLTSDGGWSLDLSEPVLSRALCHVDNAYWIPHVRVDGRVAQDQQDVADRVPRLRRTAGDARDRGHPRPLRAAARHRPGRAAATQLLRRRARPRRTASRCGTPSGSTAPGSRCSTTRRLRAADGGDRGVQRRPPAPQARPGDHPGEVRHLLQLHLVQPGRRARARLQGRLGADQPRRHRDGPGPAHQDAPGRGDRARAAARAGAARADAHRQGAQHLGHRGELRRRPQRCRGQGRVRPDPRPAGAGVATGSTTASWERGRHARPTSTGSSCGPRASTRPRGCAGTPTRCRASRSSTSRTASLRRRSRSTASPGPTTSTGSTSSTTSATASRRWSTSARSRAGSSRASAG